MNVVCVHVCVLHVCVWHMCVCVCGMYWRVTIDYPALLDTLPAIALPWGEAQRPRPPVLIRHLLVISNHWAILLGLWRTDKGSVTPGMARGPHRPFLPGLLTYSPAEIDSVHGSGAFR